MSQMMKDAQKLAEQLQAKHNPDVIRISHMLITVGHLCPLMGHTHHMTIAECAEAYCEKNNIDTDAVNACLKDIEKAEQTIAELAQLEVADARSSQGQGISSDFLKSFGKGS